MSSSFYGFDKLYKFITELELIYIKVGYYRTLYRAILLLKISLKTI